MLFNSYVFWVFFAAVALSYRFLRHRGQNRMLLVASYVFYGWWDWRFLSLILASTLLNYAAGLLIEAGRSRGRRKTIVALAVIVNLGLLARISHR